MHTETRAPHSFPLTRGLSKVPPHHRDRHIHASVHQLHFSNCGQRERDRDARGGRPCMHAVDGRQRGSSISQRLRSLGSATPRAPRPAKGASPGRHEPAKRDLEWVGAFGSLKGRASWPEVEGDLHSPCCFPSPRLALRQVRWFTLHRTTTPYFAKSLEGKAALEAATWIWIGGGGVGDRVGTKQPH
jgi:hypothetical protein